MRISDWSSDVCSSDLARAQHDLRRRTGPVPSWLPGELKEAGPVTATDSRTAVTRAGIVGVACARAPQRDGREGAMNEPETPGRGCSNGKAGHTGTDHTQPLSHHRLLRRVPRHPGKHH